MDVRWKRQKGPTCIYSNVAPPVESCIIDTADRGEAIVCTVWTLSGHEYPGIQPVGVATHKLWAKRPGS